MLSLQIGDFVFDENGYRLGRREESRPTNHPTNQPTTQGNSPPGVTTRNQPARKKGLQR